MYIDVYTILGHLYIALVLKTLLVMIQRQIFLNIGTKLRQNG